MRKIAPVLVLVLALSHSGVAQAYKNEKVTYLDDSGQPIKEKKARFLHQVVQLEDTLWELNYYFRHGPRFKSFHCSDPEGHVLNGRYISYTTAGTADTVGHFAGNKRSGIWDIYTPTGRLAAQQKYEDGLLLWTKDTIQLKQKSDSINAVIKKDSVHTTITKIEIESDFPGGPAAWLKYLNKNLRYPDEAVNNYIMGMTIIGFIVDKEGHIPENSIWVARSVEYSIDKEAIRIIRSSPPWTPAMQNGRVVRSYKKQPIVFKLVRG
jgi:protein TonB